MRRANIVGFRNANALLCVVLSALAAIPSAASGDEDGAVVQVARRQTAPAPTLPSVEQEAIIDEGPPMNDWVPCEEDVYVTTRLWLEADYLMWWMEGFSTPPLVTTSPLGGDGQLDSPTTSVAFGNGVNADTIRTGGRFRGTYWYDAEQTWAVGGDFWILENKGATEAFSGDANSRVWRPFFNTDPAVSAPDAQLGDEIFVRTKSRIYAAGLHWRRYMGGDADPAGDWGYRFDLLGGYRHVALDESLAIREEAVFGPVLFNLSDRFITRNDFHGCEIGLLSEYEDGPWVFTSSMRTALGVTNQLVLIQGNTAQTPAAPVPDPTPGGLLAQPSNIGRTSTDDFAVLTELCVNGGYQFTSSLRATVGYTFIYLSRVARPGDQIDPRVDGRFLDPNAGVPLNPAAIHPERELVTTDIWVQGLNFGIEWDY